MASAADPPIEQQHVVSAPMRSAFLMPASTEMGQLVSRDQLLSRDSGSLMPIQNIDRMMSQVLPQGSKVCQESRLLMQQLTTEVIAFVCSEANDVCVARDGRSLQVSDLKNAFAALDLDEAIPFGNCILTTQRKVSRKAKLSPTSILGGAGAGLDGDTMDANQSHHGDCSSSTLGPTKSIFKRGCKSNAVHTIETARVD